MPLAPSQIENSLHTSTAPFQTEHQEYLPNTSEPSANAYSTSTSNPGPTNFDFGPEPPPYPTDRSDHSDYGYATQPSPMSNQVHTDYGYAPLPGPISNPVYINHGYAPQPSPRSRPIYSNITSGLVWTPPPIDMANIPRNSEWTSVCGIVSAGEDQLSHMIAPQTAINTNFKYHCPRCDKGFSRRYTVKQHFTSCVKKYGNPKGLKWVDHPSLASRTAYATRKPNTWNLRRSSPRKHRFRHMGAAGVNQTEYGSP